MFVTCGGAPHWVARKPRPPLFTVDDALPGLGAYNSLTTKVHALRKQSKVRPKASFAPSLSFGSPGTRSGIGELCSRIRDTGLNCLIFLITIASDLPLGQESALASIKLAENAPPAASLEAAPYLKQGRPASANAERPTLKGKSGVEHRLVKDATGSLVPLDMVELQHPTEPDSPRVQRRDAVLVRYIARLEDGTVIEDKRRNKAPVLFRAGTATLPAAVDLGVEGMRVGEERRIRVRARDNFHGVNLRLGAAATVPRDALLFYDVELVGINPYK